MIAALLLMLGAAQAAPTAPTPTPAPATAAPAAPDVEEMVPVDQIRFRPLRDARGLDALRDDHSMDAAAATLRRLGVQFERRRSELDTGLLPPGLMARIRSLPPTEPFVLPLDGWLTINLVAGRGRSIPPPDPRAVAAIERLMAVMPGEESQDVAMENMIASLMPLLVRGNTGQEQRIRAILQEELTGILRQVRPGVRARVRTIYLRRFTAAELQQLARNAESPVGRKLAREMPAIQLDIVNYGRGISQAAVQAAMPRIIERMQADRLNVPLTS